MGSKVVGYLRVSTLRQGASGLGLEAQKAALDRYVLQHGCRLLATYSETETGKKDTLDNRPELRKAIAHAKRAGATLVVAKMDRLARSVAVTSLLHQSGVEFVACDNPYANRLTVQILAAVAENEARAVSERTSAALQAAKRRGVLLGARNPACRANLKPSAAQRGRQLGAESVHASAVSAYDDIRPYLADLRAVGLSLRAVAERLNLEGHLTRRGRVWNASQVSRVLAQATP
jgi:DNA invertase Pin-like site-specific DNA recombinase